MRREVLHHGGIERALQIERPARRRAHQEEREGDDQPEGRDRPGDPTGDDAAHMTLRRIEVRSVKP